MTTRNGPALNVEAANWLAKLQREEFSEAERAELDHWLDADPAHAVEFARVEYVWQRAERLRAFRPSLPFVERAGVRGWAIAAALAFITLGSTAWYFTTQWHVYATDLGERRTVALEDGSQVNLNTASRLEVDFTPARRSVRLTSGEALFNVAPDSTRPFIVHAGKTVVRAVGTAFNVRLRSQIVEVTVTEGVVAVDEDRLAAGSAAVVAAGAINRMALDKDVMRRRIAWREGAIELKGETLEQAVEEFNRYRKSKLVVADPAIAGIRVGGRFETQEAQKFLSAVQASFAVRVVQGEGGVLYLFGPG